ncbi:MAG: methyl-accepting chemotaxis protein [Lachnospiraceae bacterium]|nr:methyl-accepting chemotaxis protein [Lachnospiraceae bacterium]
MKVRRIGIFTQLFIWLAVLLLIGNVLVGYFAYSRSRSALFAQIQSNVMNIAQCAAMNVDGEILQQIVEGDEGSDRYNTVIEQLALFRDNADIEYIYTLRKTGEEQFVFVVDADPEEPAVIGEECEATDALCATFDEQITAADDEPFTDEWGSHVSAYSPVMAGSEVVGAVGVDISANWIDEQMIALRNLVVILCVVIYIVSLGVLFLLMMKFKGGMKKLNNKIEELASGSGDLTKEIDISTGDELEVIAGNMNAFIRQIRSLVKDVAQSTEEIMVSGEELSSTVDENNQIMSGMNSDIAGISMNMEQSAAASKELAESLSESANHIADFAKEVNEICQMVQKANENAQATSAVAKENRKNAMNAIRSLQMRMNETAKDVQKVEQVKQIAEEISSIAGQTRMLSLNAQIEAARAGSMGAGFAVVATEVGNLSVDIDRAVGEINTINAQVLSAVGTLSDVLEEMIRFVSEDVAKDYDSFAELGEEYGNTTEAIREQMTQIGAQSTEIAGTIADINASLEGITEIVTLTAESANVLSLSTNKVSESFENLNEASRQSSVHSDKLSEQVSKYNF